MASKINNKIGQLTAKLNKNEGKVKILTIDESYQIGKNINDNMKEFRQEQSKMQNNSHISISKIILNS